jgi:hypothetical protein
MRAMLSLTDADKLTYFNLQKYMKRHFVPKTADVPISAVEAPAVPEVAPTIPTVPTVPDVTATPVIAA